MSLILDQLQQHWLQFLTYTPRLLAAIVVMLIFYLIGKHLGKVAGAIIQKATLRNIHEAFFRSIVSLTALFFGLIIALNILGLERVAVSLLAGGGVTAIILGFAFREIGENFLAGIFLAFSRPFNRGDFIRTEDIEGKVENIELRYTHLRSEDGRDIFVPSSQLFGKPLTNFTRDGLRRIDFNVGIDYADDAKNACSVLKKCCQPIPGVLSNPEPGAYILELGAQYIEIQIYYWIDVFDKNQNPLAIRTDAMNECRISLIENGFTVSSETTSNIAVKNIE